MHIVITGVAGNIGSFLADALLAKGHKVTGIDNLSFGRLSNIEHNLYKINFSFHNSDINEFDFSQISEKVDVVCHLSSLKKIGDKASWGRFDLISYNKCITKILDFAVIKKAKFVFSSTSDVYGTSDDLPFREDGNLTLGSSDIKRWTYAVVKLYDEHVCFDYQEKYNIPISIIRYFGVYSERARYEFGEHIPLFIRRAIDKQPIVVHGDGSQTRSMCHVDDAMRATVGVVESESVNGKIVNIGSDEEVSILDTAKLVYKIINPDIEPIIEFVPISEVFGNYKEIRRRVPDLSVAKECLGFSPSILLEAGLRSVIDKMR